MSRVTFTRAEIQIALAIARDTNPDEWGQPEAKALIYKLRGLKENDRIHIRRNSEVLR
jgi:hypothetical protein